MGIKNKEKILEVSVYDEQVECTFENGSRGTAEDCLEKDVIILTFSIIDPTSLNNLLLTYMPLLKKRGYPKHLVYLVGIEADKRDVKDRRHVSIEQTEQVLKNLRGLTYCEIGRLDTKASVDNLQMLVMNCARLILCNLKSKENKFNKWVSKFGGIQKMISLQEAEADINLRKCRLEVVPVQLLFLRSFITKLRLSSNLFKFFPIEVLSSFIFIIFIILIIIIKFDDYLLFSFILLLLLLLLLFIIFYYYALTYNDYLLFVYLYKIIYNNKY